MRAIGIINPKPNDEWVASHNAGNKVTEGMELKSVKMKRWMFQNDSTVPSSVKLWIKVSQ